MIGKKVICVLLLLSFVLFAGCVPDAGFFERQEKGLYPTPADFPNTKWICRELNMSLYMFEREKSMIGTYVEGSQSYRVLATFEFDELNISFYSSTDVSVSENESSMVHCEPVLSGHVYSNYYFDKDRGKLVCSVRDRASVNGETIPAELTFEKAGALALRPNVRWYAQELDMYLDSFSDVEGYYAGEMTLEGVKHRIDALEVGNNHYYAISIENGKSNHLKSGTTSPLIYLHFNKVENDRITAIVCDNYLSKPEAFPDWPSQISTITFKAISVGDKN